MKINRRFIELPLLAVSLAFLPACGGRGAQPAAMQTAAAPVPARAVATTLVYYDNSGGLQDSVRMVIRNPQEFQQLWGRVTSTQQSPPPVPAIDFAQEMLLVVAAGRMTPEDEIQVDTVMVPGAQRPGVAPQGAMEAVVRTVEGCNRFNSDAYPVAIVRVQRFDGQVRFTERRERSPECRSGS